MKAWLRSQLENIFTASLRVACKQNGYASIFDRLQKIVPDIEGQYTTFKIDTEYKKLKVRCQHSFQMTMVEKVCSKIDKDKLIVVDIGDSAGTHLMYLEGGAVCENKEIDALSVNLDAVAIEKIKQNGLKGVCCRAEDLHSQPEFTGKGKVDLFLSFEMLEHLFNPVEFLYAMATKSECDYFIVTVPYVLRSRIGLHQIRNKRTDGMCAENTHIFELSPSDWNLLFSLSGWRVVDEMTYFQYPKYHPLHVLKWLWRWFDFEGFYGVVLKKDMSIANQYKSW